MSKGLEALKRMEEFHNERHFTMKADTGDTMAWKFNTIKELFPNEFATIEKELKALTIIKKKEVNVHAFTWLCLEFNKTYEQYVDDFNFADGYYDLGKELLTQEEYELLKEVLL